MRTSNQQQMYASWNESSYTKWNCLALTMYDKICFIDCDKIILTNIDTIFTCTAPAATFGSAWTKTYAPYSLRDPTSSRSHTSNNRRGGTTASSNVNTSVQNLPIFHSDSYHFHSTTLLPLSKRVRYDVSKGFDPNMGGCNNPYWALQHGEKVHPGLIFLGLFCHSVSCTGTMVLLETCLQHYCYFLYMIFHDPVVTHCSNSGKHSEFGLPTCYSGKDEQSIAFLYLQGGKQWYFIDARYNHIPWLPRWLQNMSLYMQPKTYHYFNTKPWIFARDQYKDLEAWWALARNLVSTHTTVFDGAASAFKVQKTVSLQTLINAI
uniref:Glycogenin-1 n=1 Tax=Lygus hesperus TaxID=30085 RepID=A0A0A9Y550_LYGHE